MRHDSTTTQFIKAEGVSQSSNSVKGAASFEGTDFL
jgi:hypothetical protein